MLVQLVKTVGISSVRYRETEKEKKVQQSVGKISKLQLSNRNTVISNSHAQEDSHSPVPKLAGDDEDRYFWFVFTGQMQLHEE